MTMTSLVRWATEATASLASTVIVRRLMHSPRRASEERVGLFRHLMYKPLLPKQAPRGERRLRRWVAGKEGFQRVTRPPTGKLHQVAVRSRVHRTDQFPLGFPDLLRASGSVPHFARVVSHRLVRGVPRHAGAGPVHHPDSR